MVLRPGRVVAVLAIVALFLGVCVAPASAQRRQMDFLSDAETEHTIRDLMRPVFEAAGLNPAAINIVLVNDKTINAFVAGGQNIFIHTGLLLDIRNADELIGVLAHETGHIAGGHLARGSDAMENALLAQLIGLGVGIASGVASGNGSAAAAGMLLGQHVAERNYLSFSRGQEGTADNAGLTYLDRAGISARGMLSFLERLDQENPLLTNNVEAGYTATHPLTPERLDNVRAAVARSPNSNKTLPPEIEEKVQRIQAKLRAYLDPDDALRRYRDGDSSIVARYGRAYAYFRQGDSRKALPIVDGLIAAEPRNPYFYETRGDLMLQTGRPADAVPSYRKAVELAGDELSIRISLAHALLEENNPKLADDAIRALDPVLRSDQVSAFTWRLAAEAYGLKNNEPMAILATAEEATLSGDIPRARALSERAEKLLPAGSPGWIRAQDIRSQVENKH